MTSLDTSTDFLNEFNFSSANAHLVCSVPGYHKDSQISLYGHMKLRKVLQEKFKMTLSEDRNDALFYQVRSCQSVSIHLRYVRHPP